MDTFAKSRNRPSCVFKPIGCSGEECLTHCCHAEKWRKTEDWALTDTPVQLKVLDGGCGTHMFPVNQGTIWLFQKVTRIPAAMGSVSIPGTLSWGLSSCSPRGGRCTNAWKSKGVREAWELAALGPNLQSLK